MTPDKTTIVAMKHALELAGRGRGMVSPNPLVGCVLTDSTGTIIGEGWHQKYGEAHAEVNALNDCIARGNTPAGATAYVTLEPCSHYGKTPPCADLLISSRIAKCMIAMRDPFHEVNGEGINKLNAAGIEVEVGLLEQEAKEVNKFFIKHVTTGLPYLTMKMALSLDGKVALRNGASKYITSEASRKVVHQLRAEYDTVLVASATVIADDPELTVRLVKGRSPKRIILDASLRVSANSKVYSDDHRASTMVVANEGVLKDKQSKVNELQSSGIRIIPIPSKTEQLDLKLVFTELGNLGINSILIEPGPTLATTLLQSELLDELVLFYAPTVLGDDARSAFGELHLRSLTDAGRFRLTDCNAVEESNDFCVTLKLSGPR